MSRMVAIPADSTTVGCSVPEQFYFTLLAAFAKNENFIINLSLPDDDELHSRSPGTAYGVGSEKRPRPAASNRIEVIRRRCACRPLPRPQATEPCRHQLVKSVGVFDFSHAERVCNSGPAGTVLRSGRHHAVISLPALWAFGHSRVRGNQNTDGGHLKD